MILDQLVAATKRRIALRKADCPLSTLRTRVLTDLTSPTTGEAFYKALRKPELSFICEIKRASPSKGLIAPDFPYLEIAKTYYSAGAEVISVLTEPDFFLGKDQYLSDISQSVPTPLLRKDFVIDEYMIYEAKAMGASGILLICAILTDEQLADYLTIAEGLGLSVLVETHNEEEVERALRAKAKMIGVNNRNLRDFRVDPETCIRLRSMVPKDVVFVAESGIQTPEDLAKLNQQGIDAVLIGEAFMRSTDPSALLRALHKAVGRRSESL